MLKNKRWLGIILLVILLIYSTSGLAYYCYTQESGANFYVGTGDKADALEDTNEIRQIVDDLGNLLGHSKRDNLYPKDGTTGGILAIPESQFDLTNIVFCNKYDHPDDAITAIGSDNKTLVVTEAETCDTNFTIPVNVTVRFERGGKWTINTGITVTFNGQIDAGLWQIFEYVGTGTLNFGTGTVDVVYPEWWGIDGTADQVEIQAAIDALPANGGRVLLVEGTYTISESIKIDSHSVELMGLGTGLYRVANAALGATLITSLSDIDLIQVNSTGAIEKIRGCRIVNLHLIGSGATNGKSGIHVFSDTDLFTIERVHCEKCQDGFYFDAGDTPRVLNCSSQWNGRGLYATATHYLRIIGGDYSDNNESTLSPDSTGITLNGCSRSVIIGVVVVRSYNAGILLSNGCHNIIISNNIIDNPTASEGILLWSRGADMEDIKIVNNILYSINAAGCGAIKLDAGNHCLITGNHVSGTNLAWSIWEVSGDFNLIQGNSVEKPISIVGANSVVSNKYSNLFMNCLAASTTYVHAAITGTGAEQEITTGITNPDIPRNISITNSANSTGNVTIEGINAKGNSVSENITIVTGGTAYGNVAFVTVSKIIIPATVVNPDTIEIGIGDKLGLSNIVYETGDVYKVKVNNADTTGQFNMANDVDTTNDTLDMSSLDAGAITVGDDITIWYRSNLNIIE